MRDINIAAHTERTLVGHDADLLSRDLADLGIRWGVETYREGRWRPLKLNFGRALVFKDEAHAVKAAVEAWRRTDRPARPFALPPVSAGAVARAT